MTSIRIATYASIVIHFLRLTRRKLSPHPTHGHPLPFLLVLSRTGYTSNPRARTNIAMCRDCDTALELLRLLKPFEPVGCTFSILPAPELTPGYISHLRKYLVAVMEDDVNRLGEPQSTILGDNLAMAIYRLRKTYLP